MTTSKEFEEKFENGEDISEYFDWSRAKHINQEPQRVNIDFPKWVVARLDKESKRLGVTRQALVKIWIAERLEKA